RDTSAKSSGWRPRSTSRRSAWSRSVRGEGGAMSNHMVLAAGLAIFALGGLAFVFAGGSSRADLRRASVQKSDEKANAVVADRAAKKKQISDSLKDLEKKSKRK